METTLGVDWRSFFDMVCSNSRKPLFFSGTPPFWKCDPSQPDFKSNLVNLAEQVEGSDQTYLEGNAKLVAEVASLRSGIKEPRVCFFGDQYTSDCHSSSCVGWDAICVMEELCHVEGYSDIEESSPLKDRFDH